MIRGPTLIALVVVLGLACVFGKKGLESDKPLESKSVLVDIDPHADEALDDEDQTDDTDDDSPAGHANDPWWHHSRRRRRRGSYTTRRPYATRRPYSTHRPYPTHHPTAHGCSTSRPTDTQWDNEWRGKLFFECPKGHSLTFLKSVFSDCQQDRIWKFGCGYNEASKEFCHWSHGYVNDPKDGIFFNCPNNGFISGIDSIYVDGDRRYKFKCCNDEGFNHADCHQSHRLNKAGQDFEFKVDRDKRFYITGISSCFNNVKRDRAWIIDYCRSVAEKVYPEKKDAIHEN